MLLDVKSVKWLADIAVLVKQFDPFLVGFVYLSHRDEAKSLLPMFAL